MKRVVMTIERETWSWRRALRRRAWVLKAAYDMPGIRTEMLSTHRTRRDAETMQITLAEQSVAAGVAVEIAL